MPAATAVEKLAQSFLRPNTQLQGMARDVDIATFHLQMRNKAGIELVSAITSADLTRTITGASTLTVVVNDNLTRDIQRSGRLGRKVDIELDGLFFTLVGVTKNGRQLTLKFEEREVNLLRYYDQYKQVSRGTMTRAEFALSLIKEVKEQSLRYVIPELKTVEPVNDPLGPTQIIVNAAGQPLAATKAAVVTDPSKRPLGIYAPSSGNLKVKGVTATIEQLQNADTVLQVGVSLNANRKVLVSSIMTAIDESLIKNLAGGDRDSVGVFQQRPSQGWPATRDVATDAAAYFRAAIANDAANPSLSYNDLCQSVQHSGTPDAYGQYQGEAEAFVTAFGVTGGSIADSDPSSANNQKDGAVKIKPDFGSSYYFTRGTVDTKKSGQYVLTKENSWQCLQRIASEVNWRCFVVSGAVYFVSDAWLFKSKPFMRINEDSDGIDVIDYDYDEGKRQATVTVVCHLNRWSAPPGSTVQIFDMGIPDGKHLVQDVNRSLYNSIATITLIKPQPVLPEPITGSAGAPGSATFAINADPSKPDPNKEPQYPDTAAQQRIVLYCEQQLGVPYAYGTEAPGVSFDCSGLTQAAYSAANIPIPRVAQAQYDAAVKANKVVTPPLILLPGDLLFFGADTGSIEHVGIYQGNGQMIDAPHTGAVVRIDTNFTAYTNPKYVAAGRLWQS